MLDLLTEELFILCSDVQVVRYHAKKKTRSPMKGILSLEKLSIDAARFGVSFKTDLALDLTLSKALSVVKRRALVLQKVMLDTVMNVSHIILGIIAFIFIGFSHRDS